ncbi:hypothetical protein [Thiomicrospira microaerophila]|uniref:hypothetical protein n=1 Tax=Thiomicrospira microaerophila TaxID=406020 RepID=UPI0005CB543F|nr:hypothetical protein [Thiomicrospira microaerophila]
MNIQVEIDEYFNMGEYEIGGSDFNEVYATISGIDDEPISIDFQTGVGDDRAAEFSQDHVDDNFTNESYDERLSVLLFCVVREAYKRYVDDRKIDNLMTL